MGGICTQSTCNDLIITITPESPDRAAQQTCLLLVVLCAKCPYTYVVFTTTINPARCPTRTADGLTAKHTGPCKSLRCQSRGTAPPCDDSLNSRSCLSTCHYICCVREDGKAQAVSISYSFNNEAKPSLSFSLIITTIYRNNAHLTTTMVGFRLIYHRVKASWRLRCMSAEDASAAGSISPPSAM